MTEVNKWLQEIAQHVEWTVPSDEQGFKDQMERLKAGTEKVEVDVEKVCHVVKRYLNETYPEQVKIIEENTGVTVYKAMRGTEKEFCRMSMATATLLINGDIDIDTFMELMSRDWSAKKFAYPFDGGEEWVNKVQAVYRKVNELRVNPVPEVEVPSDFSLPEITNEGVKKAVNSILTSAAGTDYDTLRSAVLGATAKVDKASKSAREAKAEARKLAKEMEDIRQTLADMTTKAMLAGTAVTEVESDGTVPSGKVVFKKASEIFTDLKLEKDFEVPYWEWDGVHPHVPPVDANYIFRPMELMRVLYSIITNQRMYLHGHTGTGKTTLIEQVAARLNYPFVRINFDSEITRTDLIGRDTLTTDADGRTVSKFIDGILPTVMSGPYIACFDELDFVRPDVAYVMQSALEGNQLRITEDGDRIVKPHAMYRMFGTGNTVGQGDEHGMYSGARPQSLAFLDRFTVWLKVNYLEEGQREALVRSHYPALSEDERKVILKYTTEHLEAFTSGKVIQPLSPRGMLAIARAAVIMGNVKEAITMTVLDRANGDDRSTLKGLIDRVVK